MDVDERLDPKGGESLPHSRICIFKGEIVMAPGVRGGESLDEKFAQGFKIHSYRPAGKGPLKKCHGLQSLFHHKRYFHHCKDSFFITGIFYLWKHSLSLLQTLFHQYLFHHSITASTLFITTSVFSSLQALFFIATSTLFIITSTRIITSTLFYHYKRSFHH